MEQLVGNLVWKENNCVASRSLPFASIVLKNKKEEEKKFKSKWQMSEWKKKCREEKKNCWTKFEK